MKAQYRLWLEEDGHVFGDGMANLLKNIAELGSISQAAASLNISYRKAWGMIKKSETHLGIKLLNTQSGGENGGGAFLTLEGWDLVKKYLNFKKEVDQAINHGFSKHFSQ
jgi:molybdate transport system regulatory protein